MRFVELILKEGLFQKTFKLSKFANIIYSKKNATGKTTLLRSIFYAFGYQIPSTKGIRFDDMEFWLTIENNERQYKLYRHNSFLSIDDGCEQIDYSLPTDLYEVLAKVTGCDNKDILDNLIGTFYIDQEKGWTLLNRGKVIGNISFNIEALVRGLDGKECTGELLKLETIKRQLQKYKYMYSVAEYQQAIHEAGEDIDYDAPNEVRERHLEILMSEREPILDELRQIKSILRKNKVLAEYISDMKLIVQSNSGEEILVTRETLVGFNDNNEFLTTRREMLAAELDGINKKIKNIESQKGKEEQILNVQTSIEAFDSDIKNISIDAIATQRIINKLTREYKNIQNQIRFITKKDNGVVAELHNCIGSYAKELGIDETYVSQRKDFIFTNDLKSLSGTILHKIVFSFKLAYIKLIKLKTGIVLPIVLDSPSGREVVYSTVENMLRIIQRDFFEHQLIVASIHDYNLENKKIIELNNRLLDIDNIASGDV